MLLGIPNLSLVVQVKQILSMLKIVCSKGQTSCEAKNGHDIPFLNGQNFVMFEGRGLIFHICPLNPCRHHHTKFEPNLRGSTGDLWLSWYGMAHWSTVKKRI